VKVADTLIVGRLVGSPTSIVLTRLDKVLLHRMCSRREVNHCRLHGDAKGSSGGSCAAAVARVNGFLDGCHIVGCSVAHSSIVLNISEHCPSLALRDGRIDPIVRDCLAPVSSAGCLGILRFNASCLSDGWQSAGSKAEQTKGAFVEEGQVRTCKDRARYEWI
jgi:hypothetical protein